MELFQKVVTRKMNNELIINNLPKSATSEAIRILRTNLQFTFFENDMKTVLITSSIPGEGKSFISSNLSAAFAIQNKKVLLVDCDLRKGRQHEIFNLKNELGLSNLLIDNIKNYKKYIQKTDVENLWVLPKGITPPNPSELLSSDKNLSLLAMLKEEYDLIILDCPPVNAVTDALVLTKMADEVVIVSAYKITPMDLLVQTKKLLENNGAKIAGVVVNRMTKMKNKYYYNKYYK